MADIAKVLELFEGWLRADREVGGLTKIAKENRISLSEFRRMLREAYKLEAIRIYQPENRSVQEHLQSHCRGLRCHVIMAKNEDPDQSFYQGAAEAFLSELNSLLRRRGSSRKSLSIGIVSGSTTGAMIAAVCDMAWKDWLGQSLSVDEVRVFSLNVSQTEGYQELSGNANVLAYELARKFNKEYPKVTVEAYGLSAKLLHTCDEARITDLDPQIRKILEFTDPARAQPSSEPPLFRQDKTNNTSPQLESKLDVCILGVGGMDNSLFVKYCEQHGFNVREWARDERVIGDIAYCPVTITGQPRILTNSGKSYEFYSAVSLKVLKQLSESPDRLVILVARNRENREKTDPIDAAVGKNERPEKYCNVLITDVRTANELHALWGGQ